MKNRFVSGAMLACFAALPAYAHAQDPAHQSARFKITQLTAHGRVAMAGLAPAVSPDGRWIAYYRFEQPGPDVRTEIWLLDQETGQEEILVPEANVQHWGMDFSPDGQSVYTTRSLPPFDSGTLIRIRLADRSIEEVRTNAGREPAISPDGRFVAFNRRRTDPPGRELVVAPLDGGPERVIARRLRPEALNYPSWRSDGRALLFRALDPGHATLLMEVALDDGRERLVAQPDGWGNSSQDAWLPDGRSFLVTANQGSELWRVSYPDGSLERLGYTRPEIVTGLRNATAAPLIVATRTKTEATLWLAPGDSGKGEVERVWPYLSTPVWTADENLLYVLSGVQGGDIVVTEPDGREIRTSHLGVRSPRFARLSRAGNVLLVSSYASGDRAFWRSDVDGADAAKVTSGPSDFFGADIAPNGEWIAYTTWSSGKFAIWRIDLGGGSPTLLLAGEESVLPVISPDGEWVAAYHRARPTDPDQIVIIPAIGGDFVSLSDLPLAGTGLRWTPDGTALSFKCAPNGVQNVCVAPSGGGHVRQVTAFTEGEIAAHEWSPSGRLLVVRTRVLSDLVRIDLVH